MIIFSAHVVNGACLYLWKYVNIYEYTNPIEMCLCVCFLKHIRYYPIHIYTHTQVANELDDIFEALKDSSVPESRVRAALKSARDALDDTLLDDVGRFENTVAPALA